MSANRAAVPARVARADARRNRARILTAARALFASGGIDVPMDDIARRAEVGVGTLYRHFATKEALFAAIVAERIGEAAALADSRARDRDAGAAFFDVLDHMWAEGAHKRDFIDALVDAKFDLHAAVARPSASLRRALGRLVRRAQAVGAVRPNISVGDILALMAACNSGRDRTGGSANRMFAILRDGLRPGGLGRRRPPDE